MAGEHNGIESRLFLSADLIGSTARKQAQGAATWTGDVLAFYQQFPYRLDKCLDDAIAALAKEVPDFALPHRPTLWKAVGDELIYTAKVETEHEVRVITEAWLNAMRATELTVLDKAQMDLKGGAWIGTFPWPDRAVAVPLDPTRYDPDLEPEVVNRYLLDAEVDQHRARLDFLGPSIDIGFRVVAHASARRFVLSLEVAWAIAVAGTATNDQQRPSIYLLGEMEMKGVWGGRGYPLFWLDTDNHHAGQSQLDTLGGLTPAPAEIVRQLAKNLHESGMWPCAVHLPSSTFPELRCHEARLTEEAGRLAEIDDTSAEVPNLDEA